MAEAALIYVYHLLDLDLNENALFLLDRLQARAPDNAALTHLRALCCLRLGRFTSAYEYSRGKGIQGEHLGCSYVFALSCLHREQYVDGIKALKQARKFSVPGSLHSQPPVCDRFMPDSSSVSRLLGKLYKGSGDSKSATGFFAESLRGNPFLWDSFTDLCDSGTPVDVPNVFRLRSQTPGSELSGPGPLQTVSHKNANPFIRSQTTRTKTAAVEDRIPSGSPNISRTDSVVSLPSAPKRKHGATTDFLTTVKGHHAGLPQEADSEDTRSTTTQATSQRRSARLKQGTSSSRGPSVSAISRSDVPRSTSSGRPGQLPISTGRPVVRKNHAVDREVSHLLRPSRPIANPDPKRTTTGTVSAPSHTLVSSSPGLLRPPDLELQSLLDIFLKLGTAYHHLKLYRPKACLDALVTLPADQQATPWVISKTARAQYELSLYKDAKSTFAALRKVSPAWMEDLEVYSTVLWHLEDDIGLAMLAHELVDSEYLSPQAWCAVGNSFSRQGSFAEAIKCFRRAIQLRPHTAHAHSLLGHAFADFEQYDEAATAFRRALQVDKRHFPAWTGLGRAYQNLGKFQPAVTHYLVAEQIFPTNAIVLTHIAMVQSKLGAHQAALGYLQRAAQLEVPDRLAASIKVQLAKHLLRHGSPQDAIRQLRLALRYLPGEFEVHFLLGRAYTMLGKEYRGAALKCLMMAESLKPRNPATKDAIAALSDSE